MGFAAAAVVGGLADNPVLTVLWRALLVMIACWLIGRLVGLIMQKAIHEHIENYKQQNPIPEINGEAASNAESNAIVEEPTDEQASSAPARETVQSS